MPRKKSEGFRWRYETDPLGNFMEYDLDPGLIYEMSVMVGPKSKLRGIRGKDGQFFFSFDNQSDEWGRVCERLRFEGEFALQAYGEVGTPEFKIVGVNYDVFR